MLRFSSKLGYSTARIVVLLTACASVPALATFKCVDERGVTHYGDVMPPQCAKTPISEVSGSGTVLKRYAAPLTPEQLAARNEQEIKDREARRIATEQKVKDAALLASYSTEKEFDISRDRELLQLQTRLNNQKARITDLDATVLKRQNDLEFYKSGRVKKTLKVDPKNPPKPVEAPPELVSALARAEKERAAVDVQIANAEAERQTVTARYEVEKARWMRLKYGESAAPAPPKAADVKPAAQAKK
jgi:hypothetical protein